MLFAVAGDHHRGGNRLLHRKGLDGQEFRDQPGRYLRHRLFVAIDNEKEKYETFAKYFFWISSCNLWGREGQAARDYYIFDTPTSYLVDANEKMMLKPISVEQIQAWLEMVEKTIKIGNPILYLRRYLTAPYFYSKPKKLFTNSFWL